MARATFSTFNLPPSASASSSPANNSSSNKIQTSMTGDNIFLLVLTLFLIAGCILLSIVIVSKRCQDWVMRQCGRRPENDGSSDDESGIVTLDGRRGIPLATFTRPILRGVQLPVRTDAVERRGLPPSPPSSTSPSSSPSQSQPQPQPQPQSTSRSSQHNSSRPRPTSARWPFWTGAAAPTSQSTRQENRMVLDGLAPNDDANNVNNVNSANDINSSYGLNSDRARLVRERLLSRPLPRLPATSAAAAAAAAAARSVAAPSPPPSPAPVLRTATASPVETSRPNLVVVTPNTRSPRVRGPPPPRFPQFSAVTPRSVLQTDARHSQQSMTASVGGLSDDE
ncbi:hypothetical protein SCUCBS95973_009605 [Sporothrix curviconia]|uniref:Uncharacterized protein n=1 Tax=Sporothrix curviconia TaxID=1260050 RepID=A0ABP0CZ15_9PEZI